MKNTEIFNDYDMVVSVSQKAINDQLTHLTKMGVIPNEFIVAEEVDEQGNFHFKVLKCFDEVPKDPSGNPSVACIDGKIAPGISIEESGTNVVLVVNFTSGSAYFFVGEPP